MRRWFPHELWNGGVWRDVEGLKLPKVAHHIEPSIAVLITMYCRDSLCQFQTALASIENQTGAFSDIHIYLCCDGPLTMEQDVWLSENRNRFYKILRNSVNEGLARSLNRLIESLENEAFVFRMDGDDISLPGRFEKQIRHMKSHPLIGISGCQVYDINDEGQNIGKREFPVDSDACRQAIKSLMPLLHPTFCIRRDVFHDPRNRYPDAHLAEDLAFLVVALENGVALGNSPEFLFQWRIGHGFFSRRQSLKRGLAECRWYSRAIYHQEGFLSFAYIKPLGRLFLRMMPSRLQEVLYRSSLRSKLLENLK